MILHQVDHLVRKCDNGKKKGFFWSLQINYAFSEKIKPHTRFFTFVDITCRIVFKGCQMYMWEFVRRKGFGRPRHFDLRYRDFKVFQMRAREIETLSLFHVVYKIRKQIELRNSFMKKSRLWDTHKRELRKKTRFVRPIVCWRTIDLPFTRL